jgi:hypothetical protein
MSPIRKPRRAATPRPPARVPAHGELTRAQQIQLAEHLASELDLNDAAQVFYAIEHWWFFGPSSATSEAAASRAESRERDARIAALATSLRRELGDENERGNLVTHGEDPHAMAAALDRIANVAARLSSVDEVKPPARGPPVLGWREQMIAVVRAHYPPGRASVTRDGHFETTIELLLEYLGEGLEDLHIQILRTLKRDPRCPFIARVDDPRTEPRPYLPWSAGHPKGVRPT